MTTAFNLNLSYLSHRLFTPQRPSIGAHTYLNVNLLPDFVEYIKTHLTPQQLLSLSEYHLQTYIMELSIKEKVTETLDSFVDRILKEMRAKKEFWMNAKIVKTEENEEKQKQEERHQHQAIVQFQKDVNYIRDQIPQHEEKPFNNVKKRRIQQSFQLNQNSDFIDKQKEILKINLTNYSMMPAYVLRQYLKDQKGINKLPTHQNLSEPHKELLHELQNCVQYFMMQQKPKLNRNQNIRKRENSRQRRLPAYLLENCGEQFQQQIEEEISVQMNSRDSHSLMQNPLNPEVLIVPQLSVQKHQLKSSKEGSLPQSESSSQSDSQNQYYQKFHQQVAKRAYYDSKMFNKENLINQSHNVMEILRCLVYNLNQEDQIWFENRWREQELQRTMREQRKKQEEEGEGEQGQEGDDQESDEQQDGNKEQNENNKEMKNGKNQEGVKESSKQQVLQAQPIIEQHHQTIVQQPQRNQIQQQQSQQKSISQQINFNKPQQPIEIGTRKSIFNQSWKSPTNYSFKHLSRHLSERFLSLKQIYFIATQYITRDLNSLYKTHKSHSIKQQHNSLNLTSALIDPQISLDDIARDFKQMIEHPQHVKLSAFKTQGVEIPWQDKDYLLFLKGLLVYFFIPTNNRKIAQYMMENNGGTGQKNIQANHVKYVKGIYLKNMGIRIDRGQSGGGKKGRMQGKTEFIQKDIDSFSMKYFDKLKKSKKKLKRRRFDDQIDAGEQADSAY